MRPSGCCRQQRQVAGGGAQTASLACWPPQTVCRNTANSVLCWPGRPPRCAEPPPHAAQGRPCTRARHLRQAVCSFLAPASGHDLATPTWTPSMNCAVPITDHHRPDTRTPGLCTSQSPHAPTLPARPYAPASLRRPLAQCPAPAAAMLTAGCERGGPRHAHHDEAPAAGGRVLGRELIALAGAVLDDNLVTLAVRLYACPGTATWRFVVTGVVLEPKLVERDALAPAAGRPAGDEPADGNNGRCGGCGSGVQRSKGGEANVSVVASACLIDCSRTSVTDDSC